MTVFPGEQPDEAEVYLDGSGKVDHVLVYWPESRVWTSIGSVRTFRPSEEGYSHYEDPVWEELT